MADIINNENQGLSISQKVLKNTFYNIIGTSSLILVSLILIPYILHNIGEKQFGIWVMVNILIAYLGFFDIGIRVSVIKYISEFYTEKDFRKLNQFINTAFVFYLVLSVVFSILALVFSKSILNFFNLPPALYEEVLLVIWMGIICFACRAILGIFPAILMGLQHMDTINKILIFSSIAQVIGTVFVIERGYGLTGLIINYLIIILLEGSLLMIWSFKKLPALKFDFRGFDKKIFKMIFGFSTKVNTAKLAFLVNFHIDKILLARFMSISLVTFYELGFKITFTIRRLSLLFVSALMPAVSEINVSRDREILYNFYLRSFKYLIITSAALFSFVIFNAQFILTAWVGSGYAESIAVIQVLALGYFINVLANLTTTTALGLGRPEFEMKYSFLVAPLNIILSILLILKLGLIGACIGTTISLIIGAAFLLKIFFKYLEKSLKDVAHLLWKPIFAAVLSNLLVLPFNYLSLWISFSPRVYSIVILLVKSIIFFIIYIYVISAIKLFDKQDTELVKQHLPIVHRFMR